MKNLKVENEKKQEDTDKEDEDIMNKLDNAMKIININKKDKKVHKTKK